MAVPGSVVGQTMKFYAISGVGFMDAEDSRLALAVRFGELLFICVRSGLGRIECPDMRRSSHKMTS